jgi:CRISPR-associated protein Cmr4
MQTKILYLFTRTPLHVGAGSSVGAIDQPIQRERHTGFPVIPGSSLKGVLADGADYLADRKTGTRSERGRAVFGHESTKEENAASGGISFGEAKLLAFPVRSAKGCFAWLTCPLALQRWARATGANLGTLPSPTGYQSYHHESTLGAAAVFEDFAFHRQGDFTQATLLTALITDSVWSQAAAHHLALVSNDLFSHFAQNSCEVAQHVKIDDESGTASAGALFNQENVPAETLFYSTLTEVRSGTLEKLTVPPVLQIGGDATTGLGFCSAQMQ